MKKKITLFVLLLVAFNSCKKAPETQLQDATKNTYSVNPLTTKIHWEAYKTTAKTPVKGVFTSINIANKIQSDTKQGAFANLEFSIPVSSFFSKDEDRDAKIKKLFFGLMKETTFITGRFYNIMGNEKEGTMTLYLKMNTETIPIPMTYTIVENKVSLNGKITNLIDWKIEKAFKSLHNACKVLHTGEDGVSRTWEDVTISATTLLNN